MKTKIDYATEYAKLKVLAENELKNVLLSLPEHRYDFISDEDLENLSDNINDFDIPIVDIMNDFDGRVMSIYAVSVRLTDKGGIIVEGLEGYYTADVREYSISDVLPTDVPCIFDYINI